MIPSSVFRHCPLGVVAAVLLIMGTIFLGRAAKGRRVVRRASDHNQENLGNPSLEATGEETNYGDSTREETERSNSRADIGVQDIFLSHSGRQKPFVESLYNALQRANHIAFFDQHTLPKGFSFPPRIKQAARGCKLGVVVLSEAFLTSKWPMIELEMLVSQRGPEPCVLPLFYELDPADLTNPKNLKRWRREWKKMGDENVAEQWELAVKGLRRFNGEVFKKGTSVDAYINNVVKHICSLIPCHVPYDCSWIQGQSRLVQEMATKFEQLDASRLCMVGLHGVGGLGKTTLCKAMVNYYSSHYHGRSFLIEFPSTNGGGLSTIVLECKKALHKLTDASSDHLLNKADSFDEVAQLMKDRVGRHDVFLAIDNVWDGSLEEAKRILWAGFSTNSKILVTSRSEEVLKDLLMITRGPVSNARVAPLPAPEREEALQIFQETFGSYDLRALVDSSQIDKVLGKCWFSGSYHALALKAFAKYVKRVCMTADLEGVKHHLSCILKEFSSKDLRVVEDVIRLSYDDLPEEKKHVFLDIAVCLQQNWKSKTYATVQKSISVLYWNFPESKTTMLINELSLDGLIQIEINENGEKLIGLHDLYLDLALREIARSPRFLIKGITKSVEKIEWEKLETVYLRGDEPGPGLFEELQQCKCPELKLLEATSIDIESGILINSLPSLRVLSLVDIRLVGNEHGSGSTVSGSDSDSGSGSGSGSEKETVVQSHSLQPLEQVLGMASLDQKGTIKNSRSGFERGPEGLGDASGILFLHGLVRLQYLAVEHCSFVFGIVGLNALTNLQKLTLVNCGRLERLDGLSGLAQLQVLHVSECTGLQKLPDMSSLTCLERLKLVDNEAMEEVGGLYLSSTLKHLDITGCRSLRSCPSLEKCMHLETLATCCIYLVSSLQKLPNLHTCLQRLTIVEGGRSTIKKIDVGTCFTNLKYLSVSNCEVGDLSALHSLKELEIWRCSSLKKLNVGCFSLKKLEVGECRLLEEIIWDLKVLSSLQHLRIKDCGRLQELSLSRCESLQGSSISIALKDVSVEGCRVLKRVPDVSSLTCLERLKLYRNEAMEEVGGEYLSSTLKHLDITGCRSLRTCPSLEGCMHMETLATGWAPHVSSLANLPNPHTCLQRLTINEGGRSTIKKINVGRLTSLNDLAVFGCGALKEVRGLSCTLKAVRVQNCRVLKRMQDVSGLTCLERLYLVNNKAMKEVGGLSSTLKYVSIQRCRILKRMPDVSCLTCLEELDLHGNEAMEEVGGEYVSSTLKRLDIGGCRSLRSYPSLYVCVLPSLELVTGYAHLRIFLQKLRDLSELTIDEDGRSTMKKIDVWTCLTNLESLTVRNCGALKEIEDISALRSLKNLNIFNCPRLKKVNVGCKNLNIFNCPRLKKVNVGCGLKMLWVWNCKALVEIKGDVNALPSLDGLTVGYCPSLKKLESISSTPLQWLSLSECKSLQKSSIPEAILPRLSQRGTIIDIDQWFDVSFC